jgi:hypothetical protein
MTTLMMVLPTQFDEALRIPRSIGPTCLQEGTGSRPWGIRKRIPQQDIAGLIKHHKVAAAPSQPWRGGPIGAVGGLGAVKALSGTGRGALLAHSRINIRQEIPI